MSTRFKQVIACLSAVSALALMIVMPPANFASAGGRDMVKLRLPSGEAEVERLATPVAASLAQGGAVTLASRARILGLGEGSHGTREFAELRTALIMELARRGTLGAVALEASFGDCIAANAFVLHGTGTAARAVRQIRNWPWQTTEMATLLSALRAANSTIAAPSSRIRFECFDVQQVRGALEFIRSQHAAQPAYASIAPAVERVLAFAATDKYFEAWNPSVANDVNNIAGFVDGLPTGASDPVSLPLLAESLRGAMRIWTKPDMLAQVTTRDDQMASMLQRLSTFASGRTVAVWAHNGHVMRYQQEIQPGLVYKTLGLKLTEAFGAGYVPLAFVFDHGSFLAVPNGGPPPRPWHVAPLPADSLTGRLAAQGINAGFVDFTTAANARTFKGLKLSYRQVEAVFDPATEAQTVATETLSDLFDGVVAVTKSEPTRPLDTAQ